MNLKKLVVAVGMFGGVVAGAMAATATGSMQTTITVSPPVVATACSFGGMALSNSVNYTYGSTTEVIYPTTLGLVCTGSTLPTSFALSAGTGVYPLAGSRRAISLVNPSFYMNYQIKTSTGITLDEAVPNFGGSLFPVTLTGGAASVPLNIVVPANQIPVAGSYMDTVTITATY